MLNKTKAAMPGRQCYYTKLVRSQDSTLIDQVNGLNHSESDGLSWRACLRCRRLISPLAAVTRKPAVLSPSSFSSSISSITSCGILIVVICDFAFFAPVAIVGSPYDWCMSVYAKKMIKKGLKCISLECSVKSDGDIHHERAKPGSVSSTGRASNHNVNRSNDHG